MFAAPSVQEAGHPAVVSCTGYPPLPDKVTISGCTGGICYYKVGSQLKAQIEFMTRKTLIIGFFQIHKNNFSGFKF